MALLWMLAWCLMLSLRLVDSKQWMDFEVFRPQHGISEASTNSSSQTLLSPPIWQYYEEKLTRVAESTVAFHDTLHSAAIAKTRSKRDHPLSKILFRDDKGVKLLDRLEQIMEVNGSIEAILDRYPKIILATSHALQITIIELDLQSLEASHISSFAGAGACGFSSPDGRLLLVCGPGPATLPLNINQVSKVVVRELVAGTQGYTLRHVRHVFMDNLVSTAEWSQDGEDYLLLAKRQEIPVYLLARSSNNFFADKQSPEINFEGNVQIYRWIETDYDLVQSLPAERPERVVHFVINNFHYVVVAEGDPDTGSVVYRYSLDLGQYVLLQKLKAPGAASGVAVFTLGTTIEKDTFIALATDCSGVCQNDSLTIVYKYSNGKFMPFQALAKTYSAVTVNVLANSGEVLLVLTCSGGQVLFYQYSGWRFVRVEPDQTELHDVASTVVAVPGEDFQLIGLTRPTDVSVEERKTQLYRVHYVTKSPLKDHHATVSAWVQKALQISGVAATVLGLADSVPRTDRPHTFSGDLAIRGNLTVNGKPMTVRKITELSTQQQLPTTVDESLKKVEALLQQVSVLQRKAKRMVSLSSPDHWPRKLVVEAASVLYSSSAARLHVNTSVGGQRVPASTALVPLTSVDEVLIAEANFGKLVVQGDSSVDSLNSVSSSRYVTLAGNHAIGASVTLTEGAATSHVSLRGTINGRNWDEDILNSVTRQHISGKLQCRELNVEQLSSSVVNSINMDQLFNESVTTHGDARVKGSLRIAGNLTYDGDLAVDTVFGRNLKEFAGSVLLTSSDEKQVVTGTHTYKNVQAGALSVRGLVNGASPDDLLLNRPGLSYSLPAALFPALRVNTLAVTQQLNSIAVLDGKLDVMLLNSDQTVTGKKTFTKLHLSDVYEESSDETTTVEQETSPASTEFTPETESDWDVHLRETNEKILFSQERISKLSEFNFILKDIPGVYSNNTKSSSSFYFCRGLVTSMLNINKTLIEDYELTNLKVEVKRCVRILNYINSEKKQFSAHLRPAAAYIYDVKVKSSIEVDEQLDALIDEVSQLEHSLSTTTMSTTTTSTSPLGSTDSVRLLIMKRREQKLTSRIQQGKSTLKKLQRTKSLLQTRNVVNQANGSSNRFDILADYEHSNANFAEISNIDLVEDLNEKIKYILLEIESLELELSELKRSTRNVLQLLNRSVIGKKGDGSLVHGTVSGYSLQDMNLHLKSMAPSSSEQEDFIVHNTSLISNVEFRTGLTARLVNNVNVEKLSREIIPLSTSEIPMRMEFENEIKISKDLSSALINGLPAADFVTLSGDHTFEQHVTIQDNVHSESNVTASLFNGISLSATENQLAKKDESQMFLEDVTFLHIATVNMTAEDVEVAGVNLSDVLVATDKATVTGLFNFSSLHMWDSVTHIEELYTDKLASVNITNLFKNAIRRDSLSQTFTGRKKVPQLMAGGNVSTKGLTFLYAEQLKVQPTLDLSLIAENSLNLTLGGTLNEILKVEGSTKIKNLQLKGLLDGVSLPFNWLRSVGDQTLSAADVILPMMRAELVDTSRSRATSLLHQLVEDTVKTDQPFVFRGSASFENVTILQPLEVYGTVQGLVLQEEAILADAEYVVFTAPKTFLFSVNSSIEVESSINGVAVEKLCAMNDVVNVTIHGDAVFKQQVSVQEITAGSHSLPVAPSAAYWRMEDTPVVVADNITFAAVEFPVGLQAGRLNGEDPAHLFRSLIERDCRNLSAVTTWSFENVTVTTMSVNQVETETLQGVVTQRLHSVLKTAGDQTIDGFYTFSVANVSDLRVSNGINGVPMTAFCLKDELCRVVTNTTFLSDLHVEGDLNLMRGSRVQGVEVGAAARALVSLSTGGWVLGVTTIMGDTVVQGPLSVGGLVDGVLLSTSTLMTKSGSYTIPGKVSLTSHQGTALSAKSITSDDGLFSNYSLSELFEQSVLVDGNSETVIIGQTIFDKPIFLQHAGSTVPAPDIGPPAEIVNLKRNYGLLQEAIRLNYTDAGVEFLGWEQLAEIPSDWHRVIHVRLAASGQSLVALVPWAGDALLLRRNASGDYDDEGVRLSGSCITDVQGWMAADGPYFVTSSGCGHGNSTAAPAWLLHQLLFNSFTIPVGRIDGATPRGAAVVTLQGRPCPVLVSLSSVAVFCDGHNTFSLLQELLTPRPIQVCPVSLDSGPVLVVAGRGLEPYGGTIDLWRYEQQHDNFTAVVRLPVAGLSAVAACSDGAVVTMAAVSRAFTDTERTVAIYRVSGGTAEHVQRMRSPRAREVALAPHPQTDELWLFVLTLDGVLLRYSAAASGGRFEVAGRLQQPGITSMAVWLQHDAKNQDGSCDIKSRANKDSSELLLGVISSNRNRDETKFILYRATYSKSFRSFLTN